MAIRTRFRAHAKANKIFPIERGKQESSSYSQSDREMIALALGIEGGHFVLAHERGHAVIEEWHPLTTFFQRRPGDVPYAIRFGGFGQSTGLSQLLFGREILPEKGDAICLVSTLHNAADAGRVAEVDLDNFCPAKGPLLDQG